MCFIVCYFMLYDLELKFGELSPENFIKAHKESWIQNKEAKMLIAFIVCNIILFPLPSSVFDPCRSQYRLVSKIISEGPESAAYQQFLEQVLEQNDGRPGALSDRKDTVRVKKAAPKVYINTLWPISTVI